MNSLVFFTLSLVAIGLCSAHFCFGYWLGQSRRKKPRRIAPSKDSEVDRVAYQAAVNTLVEQAVQLCTLSPDTKEKDLTEAIAKLEKSASAIKRSASSYDFSPGEIKSIVTQPDGQSMASEGNVCSERRPYPTWQYVAPYADTLPDPSQFEDVYCHDISVGGISFLSAEAPTDMQICISVGTAPNWLIMEAQVANYRLVQYKGMPMYLVGCRFSRRIGLFSDVWPGQEPVFGQPVSIHRMPAQPRAVESTKTQSA